jgi:bifunctional non-homologous end joining protein LigD
MSARASAEVRVGRRTVPISSSDRVLIPGDGAVGDLTKLGLAEHYAAVGDAMVPHVRDRPLALQGFPHGIGEGGFYMKEAPRHFPDWIARARVPKREGGSVNHVLANDTATLVYLAGQNVITPHVWTSRADRLERPDRLIFDLDPSTDDFAEVTRTARALGDLLRELGLSPHAMTTGSRGLHVTVPLRRTAEYPAVQAFARDVAATLAAASPDTLTTEFHIEKRGDRLYLDINRTRYGQHAVAPYAVRPLPGAPVATPLRWEELDDPALGPRSWNVATIRARLEAGGDPWAGIAGEARAVGPAAAALERLTR